MTRTRIACASIIGSIVLALGAAGCDLTYEPDVGLLNEGEDPDVDAAVNPDDPDGGGGVTSGPCFDSDPSTNVSFTAQVRPLLGRSPGGCTGCHGTSATSGFSVTSYDALRRGGQVSNTLIVVPGNPCDSVLYQKLSPAPPFGARMPYNGPPFYSPEDRAVLRDWIAEGALNN
ncbi:MAG TPA: c-type cytochrome domain-containing protein [Kofleriaceae bacterium]|nr:c-type cytochrome domain-containing protein [Kofleriaceae bacterium]